MRLNKEGKKRPTVGGVICLVLFAAMGIFLVVAGVKTAQRHEMLSKRCTASTTGTVTAINTKRTEREDSEGNVTYDEYNMITVTYYVDGSPYNVTAKDSTQRYTRNEELTVCYAPDEPDVSYIEVLMPQDKQSFMSLVGVVCMCIGLMIFIVG